MSGYEDIINIMREQGKKGNTAPIQIGYMESPAICALGTLKLYGSDLLVAEHLKTGYLKGDNTPAEPLKQGDKVAVYRVSDETYIILERLVDT